MTPHAWHPHPNGGSIAAMLSAAIAVLALALVQVRAHVNKAFQDAVFDVGRAWMPGAEGIGPYSGKETLMLLAWAIAWLVLHFALRNRELDVRKWFGATLVVLGVGVFLLWPPVWHLMG